MRRDICHFFFADVNSVYYAYLDAATKKFERKCDQVPGVKLSFGVGMSFRYNMNGGAVTIHFLPCQNGTAVDVRFSLAQLWGARYEAYDIELTRWVEVVLGMQAQPCNIPIEEFLKYEEWALSQRPPTGAQ